MKISNHSSVSHALLYHLEREIPITECVFRYGSEAWCELVCEARALYELGEVEVCDEELELLESEAGVVVEHNGEKVILDTPQVSWDLINGDEIPTKFHVYVRDNGNIVRVDYGI